MPTRALLLLSLLTAGCGASTPDETDAPSPTPFEPTPTSVTPTWAPVQPTATPEAQTPTPSAATSSPVPAYPDVLAVEVTGEPGAYTFGVTVLSPDIDCTQYTDWWEVLTPDGTLIYRRILDHSHADEQPFTRTGGPVPIPASEEVIVRAHLNTTGYGGAALTGTVSEGIATLAELTDEFASELEDQPPLPESCQFREAD